MEFSANQQTSATFLQFTGRAIMEFTEMLGRSIISLFVYGVVVALVGAVIWFFLFDRR